MEGKGAEELERETIGNAGQKFESKGEEIGGR